VQGYLNNTTATKNSINEERWFQTGDIGKIDKDGYWYIVDRKKELIKYKVSHNVKFSVETLTLRFSGFPRYDDPYTELLKYELLY
jgi:4-coumarate--CoA ligase